MVARIDIIYVCNECMIVLPCDQKFEIELQAKPESLEQAEQPAKRCFGLGLDTNDLEPPYEF
jgi:hypothetical protein